MVCAIVILTIKATRAANRNLSTLFRQTMASPTSFPPKKINLDDYAEFPPLAVLRPQEPTKAKTFRGKCNELIRNFLRRQLAPTETEADEECGANAWYWSLD